jgi:hypothetical protein
LEGYNSESLEDIEDNAMIVLERFSENVFPAILPSMTDTWEYDYKASDHRIVF